MLQMVLRAQLAVLGKPLQLFDAERPFIPVFSDDEPTIHALSPSCFFTGPGLPTKPTIGVSVEDRRVNPRLATVEATVLATPPIANGHTAERA